MSRRRHDRQDLQRIADRAMRERGLEPEFSREALAEVDRLQGPAADPSVRDLRALLWCSIDNDDSLDLDQLSAAERRPDGSTTIWVAIADVDALVKKGGAIDRHAARNTTSVYTAAKLYPMLPERLSNDWTSLVQDEDRLAVVVELCVGTDGSLERSDVYRASVRNRAKLAYDAVSAWLDGAAPPPAPLAAIAGLEESLRWQDAAAQKLRSSRHERGALDLETIETRAVFAGEEIRGLEQPLKNRARELIEDLMIATNGVTARFLDGKGFPSLRRVLAEPERWQRIVELALRYGGQLPAQPDSAALQGFLSDRRRADPERFADLSLSVVKLLGRGVYALDRPGQTAEGHFGLAVGDYTHSTAPNRRFPDLITQRLLKAALAGEQLPYSTGALSELARHCTEQEDNANKVERQVRKSAAALLLEQRIGERFDAIVTGASSKGTWVRISGPVVEGRVVHGAAGLDVGDRTRVELVHTDVERGFIDFARVEVS
jgi:exoribonuclease-2